MGDNNLRKKAIKRKQDYVRREKESVKRQKREFKKKIRNQRRRNNRSFTDQLKSFFSSGPYTKQNILDANQSIKKESKQQMSGGWLRRIWESQRKKWENRRSKRRNVLLIRAEIRRDRIENLKKAILGFIRNPLMIKRLSRKEKIVREQVRNDIKEHWRLQIRNYPAYLVKRYKKSLKVRREKIQFARLELQDSLSPLYLKDDSKTLRADLLKTLINSVVLFIIAFWTMYFLSQLVTILLAQLYSIPSVLYTYQTYWPLYTYSSLYTRQNLIIIFGIGPLVCLSSSFLLIWLFRIANRRYANLRLLLLWMAFHGVNLFFGAYVAGVMTRSGFVYSSAWIFYSHAFDIEEILFMIISLLVLIAVGFIAVRYFIKVAVNENLIHPRKRLFYILAQVFFPWIIGNGIIFFTNFPNYPLAFLIILGASFLTVLPVLFTFNTPSNLMIRISGSGYPIKPGWMYLTIFVALTVFLRIVVYWGVRFG